MKTSILTFAFLSISCFVLSQNKVEKCNKLAQEEQRICKDDIITGLISDFVVYPESALENMNEGVVYVRFTTDDQSQIKNLRALGQSDRSLSEAAKTAVELFSKSENAHLLVNNEFYQIPVRFTLE